MVLIISRLGTNLTCKTRLANGVILIANDLSLVLKILLIYIYIYIYCLHCMYVLIKLVKIINNMILICRKLMEGQDRNTLTAWKAGVEVIGHVSTIEDVLLHQLKLGGKLETVCY